MVQFPGGQHVSSPGQVFRWMMLSAIVSLAVPEADAAAAALGPTPTPVVVELLAAHDFPVEIDVVGHVAAVKSARIRTQIAGQLLFTDFKEGQAVKAGQILAQIDPRLIQATVAQDRAMVLQDRAAQQNAQAVLARSTPLLGKGLISVQDIQSQRAGMAGLGAKIAGDQAVLRRDEVELGYTSITAPFDGVAGLLLVSTGNVVTPQDPLGLAVVTQFQPIAALFPLPGAQLPELQKAIAEAGPASLSVEAWSQSGRQMLDTGRLTVIDNQVEADTGTVTLKAIFSNQRRVLWPGEFVNIKLVLDVAHDALTVPLDAIESGPRGQFVWSLTPEGKAVQTPVRTTQSSDGRAFVGSGLKPGDRVVIDGQYGLINGQATEVLPANESAANGQSLRNSGDGQLGIAP